MTLFHISLVLFLIPLPTISLPHRAYCQTVHNSCDGSRDRVITNSTKELSANVVIAVIVPLKDCSLEAECQVVDYRVLDVAGLHTALEVLVPPQSYCVEVDLCDSHSDPIAAGRIIGSYNFEGGVCKTGEKCDCTRQNVAVIGPGTPREGKALGDITTALELPQLLYSTGSTFPEPGRFDYLHRQAPLYELQVHKIVSIIREMNWRYIAVLTTADTYGSIGYSLLKKEFDTIQKLDDGVEKNCCLQFSTKMVTFKMEYNDIAAQLKPPALEDRVKVIVMWMEGRYADKILNYFSKQNRKATVYIASDGWAADTRMLKKYSNILSDRFIGLFPKFENKDMKIDANYFQDKCPQFYNLKEDECSRAMDLVQKSDMIGYAGGIFSALQQIYNALNSTNPGMNYRQIKQTINNKVKKNNDQGSGQINVYTLQHGNYRLSRDMTSYPRDTSSTCSEPCQVGESRVELKKSPRCCFSCKPCPENSYVVKDNKQEYCKLCGSDCMKPNTNRSSCVDKDLESFSILHGDSFSVSVFVFSIFGIFCNIFVMVTLIRNSTTPIVKASSPQLCYIMLISLMILLTAPILMVTGPGDFTCPLQRYIIGIGTVIPIAVLFARTNRINVIFNRRSILTSQFQKMFMSVKYNVVLVGFFASVQFCICLALHLHHQTAGTEQSTKLHVKILCRPNVNQSNFAMCNEHNMDLVYVWIAYVCAMILATTWLAYKTRRLPTNFNEARYISFVMFVVIVLTISTISTYVVLPDRTNIMYQCWSIIVAVYSILGIIYGQKMYVIYVIPEQNIPCDTNIALKKFTKEDSDHKQSASGYSQFLVKHPRHLSNEINSLKSSSMQRSTSNEPNNNNNNGVNDLAESSLLGSKSRSEEPSGPARKMSAAEKRAMFRQKGYIRKGLLAKTKSEGQGNSRPLIRDERMRNLKSEAANSISSNEAFASSTEHLESITAVTE